jgi:hypothetical protein
MATNSSDLRKQARAERVAKCVPADTDTDTFFDPRKQARRRKQYQPDPLALDNRYQITSGLEAIEANETEHASIRLQMIELQIRLGDLRYEHHKQEAILIKDIVESGQADRFLRVDWQALRKAAAVDTPNFR